MMHVCVAMIRNVNALGDFTGETIVTRKKLSGPSRKSRFLLSGDKDKGRTSVEQRLPRGVSVTHGARLPR